MIARKECERNKKCRRKEWEKTHKDLSQDCTAAFKVTELSCAKLPFTSVRTLVSLFYLNIPSNWFSEERRPPASLGNDFAYCVLSSKQLVLQLTQTYLVWWVLLKEVESIDRQFCLTIELKQRRASMLKPDVKYSTVLYIYLCMFVRPLHPLKHTQPHQWV